MLRTRIFLLGPFVVLFLLFSCNDSNEFLIEGSFHKTDPTPVNLYLLNEEGAQLIDSTFTQDNTFSVTGTAEHTNIYMIKFFNDQLIYMVIRPKDKVQLDIDNTLEQIAYYVAKSPDSKFIKELADEQNKLLKKISQLSIQWEENPGDSAIRQAVDSSYYALTIEHKEYTRNFIYAHPQSLANIMALYQNIGENGRQLFDRYEDVDIFNFVDSCLSEVYPESYSVLALNKYLNEIKEQIAQKTYIEKELEVGHQLPHMNAPTILGDTIDTYDNKENHTLILFWASWNAYSVKELLKINQFLLENPKLAKRINFISISLDTSEDQLEQFVTENNIHLPVICDYQYWESEYIARYAVKGIPATLFANQKGRVLASDLFADELFTRINESLY